MKNISITNLVDNMVNRKDLMSEHGLSFWIETEDGNLLWDVGQTNLVLRNAQKLGISIQSTTHIALSHGHYDHTGGLIQALILAPHAKVYGHPDLFIQRFSNPGHSCKSIGSFEKKDVVEELCDTFILSTEPVEVLPGIFITGQIPRETTFENTGGNFFLDENCIFRDPIMDDQALYFNTSRGIVIILGCAHSGVVNTMKYISEITGIDKIFAVFGGMHLSGASQERLELTADAFNYYDVQKIGPSHCTGAEAISYFKSRLPDRIVECMTGSQFSFEMNVPVCRQT
jgi:7,8-dihydropterin-6-yl-methyl-4-(beta-D-ribofuranosyl)aminobenzene 5'-phosphate synthase